MLTRPTRRIFQDCVLGMAIFCMMGVASVAFSHQIQARNLRADSHPTPDHHPSFGPRTYELIMGLADDETDGSFNEDFRRVIDRGFQNPAFPPATRQTIYCIPTGLRSTSRFEPSPSLIEMPEANSLQDAVEGGVPLLEAKVQKAMNELFSKMSKGDTFVLYISSHGSDSDGTYKFGLTCDLSYDVSPADSDGNSTAKVAHPTVKLALKNFDFSKCPASTFIIIADTCFSRSMVENMIPCLKDRPGQVILIGSAEKVAQDWHGELPQTLATETGPVTVSRGGVFTGQLLDALGDPTLSGNICTVLEEASARASRITNLWSLQRTENPQTVTEWSQLRPTEDSEKNAGTPAIQSRR